MFPEFAALLFAARDFGHRAHLRTAKHSQHVTLGTFYTELTELVDSIVECYQGLHGAIDLPYLETPVPTEDATEAIVRYAEVVAGTRDEALGDNRAINAIADLIEELFLRTIYRLRQLA